MKFGLIFTEPKNNINYRHACSIRNVTVDTWRLDAAIQTDVTINPRLYYTYHGMSVHIVGYSQLYYTYHGMSVHIVGYSQFYLTPITECQYTQ